ncbi:MAG: hypothetical protein V2A70_02980, partial [Candidatus Omnitrophota bacterium]
MKRRLLILFVVAVFSSGCMWPVSVFKKQGKSLARGSGVSLEILDQGVLAKGGKLYIMPFAAGVDAAAGDLLDRYALDMIKGLSDRLGIRNKFKVVSGDDAGHADFFMNGHIEQMKVVGYFNKKVFIKISGDLRATATS